MNNLFVTILLLVGLSACSSSNNLSRPEEDPRIATLQQELDRIESLNKTTRTKVEDIHDRLVALQAKADSLQVSLDKLAGQRLPQSQVTVPLSGTRTPKPTAAPPETGVERRPSFEKGARPMELKKASIFPKQSPEREYEKAYEAYIKHDFDKGIALFKTFLHRYPKHDLADNAQYWIGEIYYDTKDYPNAIIAFKEVVTVYEERSKAPDALLKTGYCYVALNDAANARIYLKRVIENYPFSEAEAKARDKLKELENL